jgi:hypothetical protein
MSAACRPWTFHGSRIGIGRDLTASPLPHHRAYGSRTTAVRLSCSLEVQPRHPQTVEMAARQGNGQRRTPAQAPGPMGGRGRVPRHVSTDPTFPQLLVPAPPPWRPQIAAQAPLTPRVPFLADGADRRVPTGSLPPEERPPQLLGHALYASAPGAPGDVAPPLLAPFDRFRADTPPKVPAGTAEAETGPLPRPTHGTLGRVALEFAPGGQESAPAPQRPGACPFAPHLPGAIVRVSYEAMPAPCQLPVAPVEAQVGP